MTCIDSETKTEILKDGNPILSGSPDVGLVYSTVEKCYTSTNKIQFTSNSFNFHGKEFCLSISYFSSADLTTPTLVITSNSFKVFARKPYSHRKKETGVKRKVEETVVAPVIFPRQGQSDEDRLLVVDPDTKSTKKVKNDAINGFKDFKDRLEELVEYNKKLNGTDKQTCIDTVIKCFLQVDPKISQIVMLSNLQSLVDH